MFDTSTLKGMKLLDLQEIAKVANIQKFKTLKKDELITQILDLQNTSEAQPPVSKPVKKSTPVSKVTEEAVEETNTNETSDNEAKTQRARIKKVVVKPTNKEKEAASFDLDAEKNLNRTANNLKKSLKTIQKIQLKK